MRTTTKEENARALALLENEKNIITGIKYRKRGCGFSKDPIIFDLREFEDGCVRVDYWFDPEVSYIFDKDSRIIMRWVYFGLKEWYDYDDQGREVEYLNSDGKFVIHQYHDNGQIKQRSEFKFKQVSKVKDEYKFKERQMVSEIFYNEDGNKIHIIEANGLETWYDYDELGREIHTKDSNGEESWSYYPPGTEDKDVRLVKSSDGTEILFSPLGGYATNNADVFFGTK